MKNSISTLLAITAVFGLVGCVFLMVFVGMYNQPMTLKINVAEQFGNVGVALQRQATVITNAQAGFATVAGLDKYYVDGMVNEAAALSRQLKQYCNGSQCNMPEDEKQLDALSKQINKFDSSYGSFIAYVSQRPQLRAADAFNTFMISVEGSANRVAFERRELNTRISGYKTHCINIPGSIFCGMRGVSGNEFRFFEASEKAIDLENQDPNVINPLRTPVK